MAQDSNFFRTTFPVSRVCRASWLVIFSPCTARLRVSKRTMTLRNSSVEISSPRCKFVTSIPMLSRSQSRPCSFAIFASLLSSSIRKASKSSNGSSAARSSLVGSSDFNRSGNACVRRRRDPHWLPHITQSVLYDQPVTVFAKNEAQTGLVLGLAQEIVYSRQIKVHLPGEFRFEFFDLRSITT